MYSLSRRNLTFHSIRMENLHLGHKQPVAAVCVRGASPIPIIIRNLLRAVLSSPDDNARKSRDCGPGGETDVTVTVVAGRSQLSLPNTHCYSFARPYSSLCFHIIFPAIFSTQYYHILSGQSILTLYVISFNAHFSRCLWCAHIICYSHRIHYLSS